MPSTGLFNPLPHFLFQLAPISGSLLLLQMHSPPYYAKILPAHGGLLHLKVLFIFPLKSLIYFVYVWKGGHSVLVFN